MRIQMLVYSAGLAMCFLGASAARSADGWATAIPPPARSTDTISAAKLAQVKPGTSTKADVQSLLGAPWRILQFNDCGMAMDDQADETWEYRGTDGSGGYRIHVEFGDDGHVHLIAKIPDASPGGKATAATTAPAPSKDGMSM